MDAFILEAIFINDVWDEHLASPFSKANEDQACQLAIDLCTSAFEAIKGDDEADAAAAAAADGSHKAMMASLRLGERAALRDTIRWLQEERALNDGKEYYQERRLKELNLDRPVSEDEIVPG